MWEKIASCQIEVPLSIIANKASFILQIKFVLRKIDEFLKQLSVIRIVQWIDYMTYSKGRIPIYGEMEN